LGNRPDAEKIVEGYPIKIDVILLLNELMFEHDPIFENYKGCY